jgi:hypothetical protein
MRTLGGARIAKLPMPLPPRRPERVMSRRNPTEHSLDIGVFGARGIPSTYSGYETFLTVMLPELVHRGHRVTMYCRRGEVGPSGSYLGVRCVVLPAVRSKQLSTMTHGYIAAARAATARHDVLLVMNVANAGACLTSRMLGSRVVLNTDGQEWNRQKWGRVGRSVFLLSTHLARHCAAALVSDSVAMQEIYRGSDPRCEPTIRDLPFAATQGGKSRPGASFWNVTSTDAKVRRDAVAVASSFGSEGRP